MVNIAKNKVDLCKPCACAMPKGSIRFVRANMGEKITCTRCNRRRFGSTYEVLHEVSGEQKGM